MANKQINQLTALENAEGDDLIPVFDVSDGSSEKTKKVTMNDALMPKWNPHTGALATPGLVTLHGLVATTVSVGAPESALYAVIRASDFIVSIIENGDPPYLYGLNKVGDMPDVSYADPRDAIVLATCSDLGTLILEVHIKDNTGNTNYTEVYAVIQDNLGLCA